jgi:hypothetical protein
LIISATYVNSKDNQCIRKIIDKVRMGNSLSIEQNQNLFPGHSMALNDKDEFVSHTNRGTMKNLDEALEYSANKFKYHQDSSYVIDINQDLLSNRDKLFQGNSNQQFSLGAVKGNDNCSTLILKKLIDTNTDEGKEIQKNIEKIKNPLASSKVLMQYIIKTNYGQDSEEYDRLLTISAKMGFDREITQVSENEYDKKHAKSYDQSYDQSQEQNNPNNFKPFNM